MHRKSNLSRHDSDKRYSKDLPVDFPTNFVPGYAKRGSPLSHRRSFNRPDPNRSSSTNMGQKPSAPSLNSREYVDLNAARPPGNYRNHLTVDPVQNNNRDSAAYESVPVGGASDDFAQDRATIGQASHRSYDASRPVGNASDAFGEDRATFGHSRQSSDQSSDGRRPKSHQDAAVDEFIGSVDISQDDFPLEVPAEPAAGSQDFSAITAKELYQMRSLSVHRNVNPENLTGRAGTAALQDRTQWMNTASVTRKKLPPFDEHAELIVSKMEEDTLLMADSPNGDNLRRDALRDMPQCLTVKRQVKQRLSRCLSQKSKTKSIGWFTSLKYQMSFAFSKFLESFNDLQYTFELWYSTLRNIEGNFGSGVATHFKFFRWLFIMNVLLSVPCLAFIILPHLLYEHLDDDRSNLVVNNATFSFGDIFTGEGYFSSTLLYYGFYTDNTMELITSLKYDMSAAYFFTMLAQFIIFFLILSISMARSYRKNFIETKGGLDNVYAPKIFCGWDFGIANEHSADLKHSSIYNELKEILEDTSRHYMRTPLIEKFWNLSIQISVNIIVLFIYVGIGYSLWYLLDSYRDSQEDSFNIAVVTAVLINVIMIVLPAIFTFIMRYEGYKSPRTALYITLFRIFLLGVTVIGALLIYWMSKASNEQCWETSFGQEIYRLVIFDFLFCVLFVALVGYARGMLQKYYKESIGEFEFSIALYTMNIIYNQTLFWLGIYFAPLLSIIIIIKLYLTWYIRSEILLRYTSPSSKSWRAAQTHTWFLILTFLSFLLVLGALAYMMVQTETSSCGPFKHYKFVYEIIQNILNVTSEHTLWKILSMIVKPGVVFLILLFMCMSVYYLRAKSVSQVDMVYILREMLNNEAKDKEFLLKHISKVSEGKWQYNVFENPSIGMNPSKLLPKSNKDDTDNSNKTYDEDTTNEDCSQELLSSSSGSSLRQRENASHKTWDYVP